MKTKFYEVTKMAKFIYNKLKYYRQGKNRKGFVGFSMFQDDKNIVKTIEPPTGFIPIKVTVAVSQPSTKEQVGKKNITVNLCLVEKYCESTIYGQPGVKTAICQKNETIYVTQTWSELNDMVEAAMAKYKSISEAGKLPILPALPDSTI